MFNSLCLNVLNKNKITVLSSVFLISSNNVLYFNKNNIILLSHCM